MCGLFGVLNLTQQKKIDEELFSSALRRIRHRGPDGENIVRVNERIILGHTRLSIIGLGDENSQPFKIKNRYWVVYNGEIHNYVELRDELIQQGVEFETLGDTEVLLQSYAFWGEDCVSRFNGMWSFAIYDSQEDTLFCSRDRFGEKPFCYTISEGQFIFSSEIKSILKYRPSLAQPNYNVISNYCRSSVGAQHEQTWFESILRLSPGCNLIIRGGRVDIRRYWNYPKSGSNNISLSQAVEKYRDIFLDAVRIRMRSDVCIGLTLSGGVDSNSIAYAMALEDSSSHYSYTSNFHDGEKPKHDTVVYATSSKVIDEYSVAKKTSESLNFNHISVDTDYSGFINNLTKIVYHLESGNSSPAVIPLMQLHNAARDKVKVVLEGQGADELLGGYVGALFWQNLFDSVCRLKFSDVYCSLISYLKYYKLRFSLALFVRTLSNRVPMLLSIYHTFTGVRNVFGPRLRRFKHLRDYPTAGESSDDSWVNRELQKQHSGGLVNLLHYGDAISMANGIESRMPFLDYRLVEFVWTLPANFKLNRDVGKFIHREAMRGIVPSEILDNRIKYGFPTPISEILRNQKVGRTCPLDILLTKRCIARGLFNPVVLSGIIEAHRSAEKDYGSFLYRLVCTEIWFRCFIDDDEDKFSDLIV